MKASQLPVHMEHAINQFKAAARVLGQLGFVTFGHVGLYTGDDQHFTTFIEANLERGDPRMDHAFGDAVRDLSIKWHERTHDTRIEFEQRTIFDRVLESLPKPIPPGGKPVTPGAIPPSPDTYGGTLLGAEGGPEDEQRKMAAAAAGT